MRFPRYPAYKNSGVDWLGEVPADWSLQKLKDFSSFSGGGTPSRENMEFWNGDIPWVSPKDMKFERITGAEECITSEGLRNSATSLIPVGRVLMVVRSGILKHTIPVAVNNKEVALNQDMKALAFEPGKCLSHFFLRWVQGLNNSLLLAWAKQGATVESIEHCYLANTVIPLPSLPEQLTILSYLDRETAKIDALIAEQQRLIELLQEKRQAVISHAVTKGLNPNAPMKDSGVEWLGEVPEHWNVAPLKQLINRGSSISYGIVQPGEPLEDGIPFVQTTNMSQGDFELDSLQKTTPEIASNYPRSALTGGEVLLGIRASIGAAHIAPDWLEGANLSRGVARIATGPLILNRFLVYYLRSEATAKYWLLGKQGSTFNEVSIDTVKNLKVCVPPVSEQDSIACYAQETSSQYDESLSQSRALIALLQERRSSLISAAVTGQIDVRGLVEEEGGEQ